MLSLYALHDRFVVQSEDHQKQYLQIDRQTANVQVVNESFQSGIHAGATCQQSFGIVGIIQLLSGKYLIHISNAEIVADLLGSAIYSVISAEVIPFSIRPLQDDLPDVAKAEEEVYLDMIRSTLINSRFHFSYLHDLTNTIQRIAADTPSGPSAQHQELLPDLISIADRRFFWNYHLLSELISVSISPWAVVLVSGFFQCFHLSINSIDFKYGLLSRRSCLNAGKRFTRRGLDEQGHPTNFAEQEQVIWYEAEDGHLQVSSFVQTRGSVPLLWSQEACMKWSPPLRIDLKPQSISLLEQHLAEHARIYGRTILLNLVNQSGKEANIVSALSANVPAYCPGSNHSYSLVSFDFHQVCRNMKYENIQVLLNQVRDDLQKMSFFYGIRHSSNRTWTVKQTQSGCFRTNCMDCLDRTNVVQSAIAKSILAAQLRDCKICHEEDIEKFPPLYSRFREIWADNADAMSRLYSGTDALKTDYTRSGRRSALGALNDGKNSILRFFLNNFRDGYCQDSLDLFLGNYQVDLSAKSSNLPYARSRNNQDGFSQLFNFIVSRSFLIFLSTLVLTVALPEHSRPSVSNAAAFSILFGPIISLALAQGNLRQFVDKPKFVRAPGLSSSHQGDDASLKSSLLKSD